MKIETITYRGKTYPKFQSEGFASKFAIPFAQQVCKGEGLDIGCMKVEWALPGAVPIDLTFNDGYDAMNLPGHRKWDYIFSSHCLEHLPSWTEVLLYWKSCLADNGVLFLYLPHFSQTYWNPWNNRKHIHCFFGEEIQRFMEDNGFTNIFIGQPDLNNSFMIFGEKIS